MLETMAAIIARNAELSARRPAIWFEGQWSTHSDFALRAWSVANAVLGPLGQSRGCRVAILSQNRIEYLEVYAAAEEPPNSTAKRSESIGPNKTSLATVGTNDKRTGCPRSRDADDRTLGKTVMLFHI